MSQIQRIKMALMRRFVALMRRLKFTFYYIIFLRIPIPIYFDHLPKTAGSAVVKELLKNYYTYAHPKDIAHKSKNEIDRISMIWQHNCFHWAKEQFKNSTRIKIVVFRNPVQRVISEYNYSYDLTVTGRNKSYSLLANKMTYLEFLSYGYPYPYPEKFNTQSFCCPRNYYTIYYSGMSESDVEKQPQKAVDMAFNTVVDFFDVIGFQDNLQEFFETLYLKANLLFKAQNNRINITPKNKLNHPLTDEIIEKIKEKNKLDMQLYERLKAMDKNTNYAKNNE